MNKTKETNINNYDLKADTLEDPGSVYNKLQDNNLYKKSFALAKNIFTTCRQVIQDNNEYILTKQLLRSGTSIGANVAEANGAISNNDFSHKISIAYKESLETKYWLDLFKASDLLDITMHEKLFVQTDEISRILYSILKKTRIFPKK